MPTNLPRTLKALNARFAKDDLPVVLYRGDGYLYFEFDEGGRFETRSVMTPRFSDVSPETWYSDAVEFVRDLRADMGRLVELKAEARTVPALMAGGAVCYFTALDEAVVTFHPTWIEGEQYEFRHNGVRVSEDRLAELVA